MVICDSCKCEIDRREEYWEVRGRAYHINDECLIDIAMTLLRDERSLRICMG